MTLPMDDLTVEIAPGADITQDPSTWDAFWVDLCAHTTAYPDGRVQRPVTINKGRSSEGSQASPSSCEFEVRNEDGALSPDNPLGPWYGKLGLNTPLRVMWGTSERFLGLISELPTSWLNLVDNSRASIRADGITRRLTQGESPLSSSLVRSIQRLPDTVGYWPCEDAEGATEAASPIAGVSPIRVDHNYAELGAGEDIPAGSAPRLLRILAGSPSIMGSVPPVITDVYSVDLLVRFDEPTTTFRTLMDVYTTSTAAARYKLRVSSTQFRLLIFNRDGDIVVTNDQAVDTAFFGGWTWAHLKIEQVGSNIAYSYFTKTADTNLTTLNTAGSSLVGTLGRVTEAGVYKGTAGDTPAERFAGHITVSTSDTQELWESAVHGYTGERAGLRLERLCYEEGLQCSLIGDAADTMPMGAQQQEALSAAFQSIEDADGGILHDLEYRTRADLYNQTSAWDLDFCDLDGTPRPLYDDKNTRNDVEVSRPNGGSGHYVDESHVNRFGRYADTPNANVEHDSLLEQVAAWLVHLGTVEAMRWPSIPVAINTETQHLLAEWQALRIGDRLTIPHEIPQLPGVDVDLLVEGWQEVIYSRRAEITLNCRPAQPWNVFELEHADRGRLWSPRAYLAEDVDATATSFDVIVPVQRVLNTVPGFETPIRVINAITIDPPHDWAIDGVSLARSTDYAFTGRWSGKVTPNGTTALPGVFATTPHGANTGGRTYSLSAWVFTPTGGFDVRIRLLSFRGDNIAIGVVDGAYETLPAGVWTRLHLKAVAPAGTSRVRLIVNYDGTPPSSDILYIDDGEIGVADAPFTTDPAVYPCEVIVGGERMTVTAVGADDGTGKQTFTVTRSVNGVAKAHAAGSDIKLYPGHVCAL